MDGDCPECKRLSANLSDATKAHFETLAKSQLARGENNPALLSEMEVLKNAAAENRGKARMELRHHEASHQDGAKPETA